MNSSIIKSYLVQLGFSTDNEAQRKFDEALRVASNTVAQFTKGAVLGFAEFGTAALSALTAVASGSLFMMDSVAKSDLQMQLLARRAYMSLPAFREMKMALDALGVSAEDVAYGPPELRERYLQLLQDSRQMMSGMGAGGFELEMRKIRDVTFQFTRMRQESQLFVMSLVKDLSQALGGDENSILVKLKDWNKWFIENMPRLSAELSSVLAPALRDLTRMWGEMADIGKVVTQTALKFVGVLTGDAGLKTGEISIRNIGTAFDYAASGAERVVRAIDRIANFAARFGGGASNTILDAISPGGSKYLPQLWGKEFNWLFPAASSGAGASSSSMAGSPDIRALIIAAAKNAGVDPALALAIASKESGMNPNAPRGAAGEYGMMQVMPSTFAAYGSGDPSNFTDNLRASMSYLSSLSRKYGGNEYQIAKHYNGSGPAADAYAADVMSREQAITVNLYAQTNDPREHARIIAEELKKQSQRQQVQAGAVFVTP